MANAKWASDWRVWAGILLGTAVFGTTFAWFASRDAAVAVEIVSPTRTALRDYVTCNGKIEPIAPHVYKAEFESSVTGVFAKQGSSVRIGETIVTLDADQVRADLAWAKIQLLSAQDDVRNDHAGGPPDEKAELMGDLRRSEADVEHLRNRQNLLENLFNAHAVTREDVNQNATALARAQALLDTLEAKRKDLAERATFNLTKDQLREQQAEEQIKVLENRLDSATVTSPVDGVLYDIYLREGDYVRAGDVLAEIADLRKVQLRAYVDEADLSGLKLNQAVTIMWDAMPERTWTGRTEQIPKEVSSRGSRSVGEVMCSVDNDKLELLPNVNVDVRILVGEKDHALVVPRGAVRTEEGLHFVFVLSGDRLRRREISLGMENSTSYEVLSGLNESDHVAVSSNLDLHDGIVVRLSETQATGHD